MTTPSQKLADALEALHQLQVRGTVAIRSADLSRSHRERLVRSGYLGKVIKGWYIPIRLYEMPDESTTWFLSCWRFWAAYLNHLKGTDWCLSPEPSIALHTENWTVPKQLLVRAAKARNNVTAFPHGTSLLEIRSPLPEPDQITVKNGLRIYSLPAALIGCSQQCFIQNPTEMRAALTKIRDASEILKPLLRGGHSTIAGRLAGAFRNIGQNQIADRILSIMRMVSFDVRESDPFETQSSPNFSRRERSPYVSRIRLMWHDMRESVMRHFPTPPEQAFDKVAYMKHIEDGYVTDAYHSLSIEGYRVTRELIDRVRAGDWNPEQDADAPERRNALAARGYWQAHQAVCQSVERIVEGHNAGEAVDSDHEIWHRELFAPGMTAGIHSPVELAGYRNAPVFIRRSRHIPPGQDAVRDAMPAFFELLKDEDNPAVRVVLGHFMFVYIHPYIDGNGRMGRFLMNAMQAGGGYPWMIVPLEKRNKYMNALEVASTTQNIEPFADFLGSLVPVSLESQV